MMSGAATSIRRAIIARDRAIMEIQPWNERKGVGVKASVGASLADLERGTVAVAHGLHGHIARLDLSRVIQRQCD